MQGNPARTRKNSTKNGQATRIGHLPIPFPDQMCRASGDLVSFNMVPASYMSAHICNLSQAIFPLHVGTCAVQQIQARFTLPFPSLYRHGVQSCLIPSQQTVPGSQSKHVSGQN